MATLTNLHIYTNVWIFSTAVKLCYNQSPIRVWLSLALVLVLALCTKLTCELSTVPGYPNLYKAVVLQQPIFNFRLQFGLFCTFSNLFPTKVVQNDSKFLILAIPNFFQFFLTKVVQNESECLILAVPYLFQSFST